MTALKRETRVRHDKTRRQEQILNEAEKIIGERGYHGFGIQELAERCGLTKPGLLHHIGSKDDLLISLLQNRDAQHEEVVRALLGKNLSSGPEERRDHFVAGMRTILLRELSQPELMRLQAILRTETINHSHPAHAHFQAREIATRQGIAKAIEGFVGDPQSLARLILALISGLQEQWLRDDDGFDLMQEFDRAIALLLPRKES